MRRLRRAAILRKPAPKPLHMLRDGRDMYLRSSMAESVASGPDATRVRGRIWGILKNRRGVKLGRV